MNATVHNKKHTHTHGLIEREFQRSCDELKWQNKNEKSKKKNEIIMIKKKRYHKKSLWWDHGMAFIWTNRFVIVNEEKNPFPQMAMAQFFAYIFRENFQVSSPVAHY